MQNVWFFDRYGIAQILLDPKGRFVNRHGHNLGYIANNNLIYNYSGKHCGWIENNVIRDVYGQVVAFTFSSNDYPTPIFPIPQIPPIPAIPQIPPIPAIRQIPFIKPIKSFTWSNSLPLDLFK